MRAAPGRSPLTGAASPRSAPRCARPSPRGLRPATTAARRSSGSASATADFDPRPIEFDRAPRFYQTPAAAGETGGCGPSRPGAPPPPLATLATQTSLDRWPAFERQAAAWGGPASVAVYVPCPRGSAGAAAAEALVARRTAALAARLAGRGLAVSLLYARHYAREGASALPPGLPPPEDEPSYDQLYPINALRNLALSQVATPLVLQADADLVPSEGLAARLSGQSDPEGPVAAAPRAAALGTAPAPAAAGGDNGGEAPARRLMLVLPVFEVRQAAGPAAAAGAAPPALRAAWRDFFEPVGVAAVRALPAWDERFRGYGLNKVQYGTHLAALGFEFQVLAEDFLCTAPHGRAPTWRAAPGTARDAAQLARVSSLYQRFKSELGWPPEDIEG